MKKILPFIAIILISITAYCQPAPQNWNWHFGYFGAVNFSSGSPIGFFGSSIYAYEGSASISDTSGNLLFYTEGTKVWNRNNLVMPNGSGLMSNYTMTQAALIVPKPDSANIYYLFTSSHYSEVDMTLNGGLGDVTLKNVLLQDSLDEKLVAVKHRNGHDYWVIVHKNLANVYYTYLVSSAGISGPVVSNFGTDTLGYAGYLKASPCGHRIVAAFDAYPTGYGGMLYDFNPMTGSLSNQIRIPDSTGFYGASFSPDNSKVYFIGGRYKVYQYDLTNYNQTVINASRYVIDTIHQLGALQIGPDQKIYLDGTNGYSLAVINNPNTAGAGCNFVDNAIPLGGGVCESGLPNFIDAYDTALYSFCNNEMVGIESKDVSKQISLFPNPASTTITIHQSTIQPNQQLTISDVFGRIVYAQPITNSTTTIDITNLCKGIYFWQLIDEVTILGTGKIVLMR